jgi:hypothetical protein
MKTRLYKGERVYLKSRQHWVTLIIPFIILLAAFIVGLRGSYFQFVFLVAAIFFVYKATRRNVQQWFVTDRRLIHESGPVEIVLNEYALGGIREISSRQSFVGRILNYGSVTLQTDGNQDLIVFTRVTGPGKLVESVRLMCTRYLDSKAEKMGSGAEPEPGLELNPKEDLVAPKPKLLGFLRASARTAAVVFAFVATLFLLMDYGFNMPFSPAYKIFIGLGILFIICMVLGFWYEGIAGSIGCTTIILGFVNLYVGKGMLDFSVLVLALPAILYLASWYVHRKYYRTTGVQPL